MPLKRQLGEGLHFKHLEHLEPPQPLQARREPPCWRRQEVTFRGRVPQRPPTPLSETALRRGHAARPSVTSAGTGAPGPSGGGGRRRAPPRRRVRRPARRRPAAARGSQAGRTQAGGKAGRATDPREREARRGRSDRPEARGGRRSRRGGEPEAPQRGLAEEGRR